MGIVIADPLLKWYQIIGTVSKLYFIGGNSNISLPTVFNKSELVFVFVLINILVKFFVIFII